MSRLKVGCIRVTHPCATLIKIPYCYFFLNPVQLACIRPAASVHPEPGSNSPLLESFKNISDSLGLPLKFIDNLNTHVPPLSIQEHSLFLLGCCCCFIIFKELFSPFSVSLVLSTVWLFRECKGTPFSLTS